MFRLAVSIALCGPDDDLLNVLLLVLAKNFQTDASAFAHIPAEELYIFPSSMYSALRHRCPIFIAYFRSSSRS